MPYGYQSQPRGEERGAQEKRTAEPVTKSVTTLILHLSPVRKRCHGRTMQSQDHLHIPPRTGPDSSCASQALPIRLDMSVIARPRPADVAMGKPPQLQQQIGSNQLDSRQLPPVALATQVMDLTVGAVPTHTPTISHRPRFPPPPPITFKKGEGRCICPQTANIINNSSQES